MGGREIRELTIYPRAPRGGAVDRQPMRAKPVAHWQAEVSNTLGTVESVS
jgi:hypothetical protein